MLRAGSCLLNYAAAPLATVATLYAMHSVGDWRAALGAAVAVAAATFALDASGLRRTLGARLHGRMRRLAKVGEDFATSAADVSVMGTLLSKSTRDLANSVRGVAAASQQIAAGLQTVGSTVTEVAADARAAADAVAAARAHSEEIEDRNQRSLAATSRAAASAQQSQRTIAELEQAAATIASVVELIGSVASQTQLLSLNASVEAARAGEAGRGFAVVADEVRNLAGRSACAAAQIRESVALIQGTTAQCVDWTRAIVEAVDAVTRLSHEVSTSIGQQTATIRNLDTTVAQAAAGIVETSESLHQLGEAGQQIATNVGTACGVANQLADQAAAAQAVGLAMTGFTEQFSGELVATGVNRGLTIDVAGIKAAHNAWKTRLGKLIEGEAKIDPGEVASDRECTFGKWYYGPGQRTCAASATFQAIAAPHERVHAAARACTQEMRDGDEAAAVRAFFQLKAASAELFVLLDRLDAEFND